MEVTCNCGAVWTGLNRSHCSACHKTFGGVTAFDRHRFGDFDGERECKNPEELELIEKNGVWVGSYEDKE